MKAGIYIKNKDLADDSRLKNVEKTLESAGWTVYHVADVIDQDTDVVLSVGGDGTFLSASMMVARTGTPLLGVNLGRLGFLSENDPESAVSALLRGDYEIENRTMLKAYLSGGMGQVSGLPYALNEITVHRSGAALLGIKVSLDGDELPAYWADGLLVATSSGSTAYSLSVGGPICSPESKVLIISPIAPHNLNVRPLVVPEESRLRISIISRDKKAVMTLDNRTFEIGQDQILEVSVAQFSLKRIRLSKSNFVKALTSKLYWGEDIRNEGEQ